MKSYLAACLGFASALAMTCPAHADENDIRASDSAIEVDAGAYNLRYGENQGGTTFDTEKGWMPSLAVGVSYLMPADTYLWGNWYMHADLQSSFGQTQYNGGIQNGHGGTTPLQNSTSDSVMNIRGQVGRAFDLGSDIMLTPMAEFDSRDWRRKLTGSGGYTEYYEDGALLAAASLQASPLPKLVLSLNGGIGSTLGADVKGAFGVHNDLGDSAMWEIGGKIGYTIADDWELTTSANYDGFGFGKSSWVNAGNGYAVMEPSSYTHEISVLAGIAYHL